MTPEDLHSESINELAAALSKAQAVMAGASKDSLNPHFKNKYADLASIWDACRKPLADNGLSVTQLPITQDGSYGVVTMLLHSSGQWVRSALLLKPTKDDPQGAGSALTYARRYTLSAIVGVAPEDDDGNAASAKPARVEAVAPEGYVQWRDDLAAVAEEGTDALQAMWKASKPEYRAWLTSTNNAGWETLKKLAASKKAA